MRASGILMPVSSLPGPFGIGTLGSEATAFVDFLAEAKQTYWQILPIGPTGYGDSPYQSFSAFAGNPYFIDFDALKQEGLLKKSDYQNIKWQDNPNQVNYSRIYENCYKVLKIAYKTYRRDISKKYGSFVEKNKDWLEDYALFMALKFKNDGKPWYEWDEKLAFREPAAIEKAKQELKKDIEFFKFIQYKFYRQWSNLKKYANDKGVEIIGDMPIYVSYDSVESWTYPELFLFDSKKRPVDVAGCPPDEYALTGQLWGNPLYDWEYHRKTEYEWWTKRLKFSSEIYDIVRIDHFRGFESYYAIPYGNETAEKGEWRKGPGVELFKTVQEKLGNLSIIAEDLGFITDDVRRMLNELGYPGMKVMQFAFGEDSQNEHLPHNFETSNCIAYTGTHDNETLAQWLAQTSETARTYAAEYLGLTEQEGYAWGILRSGLASVADTFIAQLQDYLGLGAEARMNTPGTLSDRNWSWRLQPGLLTAELAHRLRRMNTMYERL